LKRLRDIKSLVNKIIKEKIAQEVYTKLSLFCINHKNIIDKLKKYINKLI